MSLTLSPFLSYDLHPKEWDRSKAPAADQLDYRVTADFDDPDILNGGMHKAVDVGNFRRGHTIKAPAKCRAKGLKHTDGALGVVFDLGGKVTLELWHLDKVLVPYTSYVDVSWGQAVGATGATGATLPNGQPMPAHTHIEFKIDGVKQDPLPYLPMPERAARPILAATGPSVFRDVDPTSPLYQDIVWAKRRGIIGGDYFRPKDAATREQVMAFLHRALGDN